MQNQVESLIKYLGDLSKDVYKIYNGHKTCSIKYLTTKDFISAEAFEKMYLLLIKPLSTDRDRNRSSSLRDISKILKNDDLIYSIVLMKAKSGYSISFRYEECSFRKERTITKKLVRKVYFEETILSSLITILIEHCPNLVTNTGEPCYNFC